MTDLPINRTTRRGLARRLLAGATLACFVATPQYAMAALTDISNSPISSASTTTVPPNVLFILDASGSMDSEFMPDEMASYAGKASFASHLCNTIYYNSAVKYLVPKKADGTDFADSTFTAADNDGFLNTGNTGNPSNLPAGSNDEPDQRLQGDQPQRQREGVLLQVERRCGSDRSRSARARRPTPRGASPIRPATGRRCRSPRRRSRTSRTGSPTTGRGC